MPARLWTLATSAALIPAVVGCASGQPTPSVHALYLIPIFWASPTATALLAVLHNWGPCTSEAAAACGSPLSLEQEIVAMGLTMDDWDDYLDVLENGSNIEISNWNCWFQRYYTNCVQCQPCPGTDPFINN